MSWPRFRLEGCTPLEEGLWLLSPEEAHHLTTVRHSRAGSLVEGLLPDRIVLTRLERVSQGWAARFVEEVSVVDDGPEIVLLAGLLKGDAFDLLLRQVTEIGVSRIVPLRCDHSVVRLDDGKIEKKLVRWRKIIEEESKQCRSSRVPLLAPPCDVRGALALDLPAHRFVAAIDASAPPLASLDVPPALALAVGPEGDWSDDEAARLQEASFRPVYLGHRILRAFTAAAVVTSWAVQGWLGDRRVLP